MVKYFFTLIFTISCHLLIAQDYKTDIIKYQNELNIQYADAEKSPLYEKDRLIFNHHDFYLINEKYRIQASIEKPKKEEVISFKTSTTRKVDYRIYGRAHFTIDGQSFSLTIFQNIKTKRKSKKSFHGFLPFNDLTNGDGSYGGGRYMDVEVDPTLDYVIIDFNKTYNPYCAYSDKYSCPVPPKENDLSVRIESGIMLGDNHHEEQLPELMEMTIEQANKLAKLPLQCIAQEYPYKLGQTLGQADDLAEPSQLHPAFYGCFDWHSAVHGHWSLIKLLKEFPDLEKRDSISQLLLDNLSEQNIATEVKYFDNKLAKSFERTYGWAWLLKLSAELHTWDDPLARTLEDNLKPLTVLIVDKYIDFLPRLVYPIRVGTHTNTAFGLSFAWDYAHTLKNDSLLLMVNKTAEHFYLDDKNCPMGWEPSGYDFLSPCLEEIDLMRRVLGKQKFMSWIRDFFPALLYGKFAVVPGRVIDRTDGHLVHLDGLNFSRAWVFKGLAHQYSEFEHLNQIADEHIKYSFPNLIGDDYEGGHWLGTFAIYSLSNNK